MYCPHEQRAREDSHHIITKTRFARIIFLSWIDVLVLVGKPASIVEPPFWISNQPHNEQMKLSLFLKKGRLLPRGESSHLFERRRK